jgi:hypothetical protein
MDDISQQTTYGCQISVEKDETPVGHEHTGKQANQEVQERPVKTDQENRRSAHHRDFQPSRILEK